MVIKSLSPVKGQVVVRSAANDNKLSQTETSKHSYDELSFCGKKDDSEKDSNKLMIQCLKVIPFVASIAELNTKNNKLPVYKTLSLSSVVGTFAKKSLEWGALIFAFNSIKTIADKTNKKSDKITKFQEKHPLLTKATDLLAMFALYCGGVKMGQKLKTKIPSQLQEKFIAKTQLISDKIDKSKISEKIYEPLVNKFKRYHEFY